MHAGHEVVLADVTEHRFLFFFRVDIDDDPFESLRHPLYVVNGPADLQHPFPDALCRDDLIFGPERNSLRHRIFPFLPQLVPILRRDDLIEGQDLIVDKTGRRVPGQFKATLGHKQHRPVPVIPAPIGHAGQIGQDHRFTALAFPQSFQRQPFFVDILDDGHILGDLACP